MQEDKELELLREYFDNDKDYFKGKNKLLRKQILEIQKQSNLKSEIDFFKKSLTPTGEEKFNEILKELGYEG